MNRIFLILTEMIIEECPSISFITCAIQFFLHFTFTFLYPHLPSSMTVIFANKIFVYTQYEGYWN